LGRVGPVSPSRPRRRGDRIVPEVCRRASPDASVLMTVIDEAPVAASAKERGKRDRSGIAKLEKETENRI